jgi:ABC-type dipeptide/oligopeptide/nickel transport system permease component
VVNARAHTMERGIGRRSADRLAASFVLVLLGVGSLALWIGIPAGALWFFGHVTDSTNGHFLLSLVFIPVLMAFFAPVLFWLNGLYLRVTGVMGAQETDEEEDHAWRGRGPLELFLYAGMAAALVSLFVWFFFFAENPPEIVW